jgi:hypothetical protein
MDEDIYQEIRVGNCLENQVGRPAATHHGVSLFTIALRMLRSFRMHAVNVSFFGFPA